jgi:putative hydrolase of the HAD superfamily
MNKDFITINDILDVEKHIDGLEAVIFDIDDTLYSEKEYVRSGYKKIAEAFGMPEMEEELWQGFLEKQPAIDVVLSHHGLEDRKEKALHIYRSQTPDIHLYPGAAEMLKRIGRTHKVAIITDGRPEGQREKIETLGLASIPFIITDELGGADYRKPNPRAFHLMLEKLDTQPQNAAYVGDNINKDFKAPEELGMTSIYFKNTDGLYT